VNQRFYDMGMLGEAIEWDINFRQIEAGKLRAIAAAMRGLTWWVG
jgi:hypothetical protein